MEWRKTAGRESRPKGETKWGNKWIRVGEKAGHGKEDKLFVNPKDRPGPPRAPMGINNDRVKASGRKREQARKGRKQRGTAGEKQKDRSKETGRGEAKG